MSDTTRHAVRLYGKCVGSLFSHENFSWFEFAEDYLTETDRPVLGLRFEEDPNHSSASNMRLPVWFSNLLPEGLLRNWIAAERYVSPERELELISRIGHDPSGAVRILPNGFHDVAADTSVSSHLTDGHQPWKFSLAGVALKFSMIRSGERFVCTATGEGGDWIVKLPETQFANVPVNEYTMMRFAESAGIEVPEVRLVHRDTLDGLPEQVWAGREEYAYAVERFDRAENRRLVHIEDFAQVRGKYPASKYEGNFETVAALAYRGHDIRALREFVRRFVFFVLIGNGDAHLKNWSLIYRDRRIQTLSPAYDIMSSEVYPLDERGEDLGMRWAGSRRFDRVRIAQFERLATKLGVTEDLADVARETISQATLNWPRFAEELTEHPSIRDKVGDLVTDRAALLLRQGR